MYKPEENRAEALVDRTLALATVPAEEIRRMRPVGAPQVLFPSKAGRATQWTIDAVLTTDRQAPLYRSWRSGMPDMATTLIDDGYSGSTRNSLETM